MASAQVSDLGKAVDMATYGAYPRDEYGYVIAPPRTFEATNDLVVIAQAMQWADGYDLEVWHEGQCVGTVQRRGLEGLQRCPKSLHSHQATSTTPASVNFT
jgi:hypothetical protein